jgi:hypothetical protein
MRKTNRPRELLRKIRLISSTTEGLANLVPVVPHPVLTNLNILRARHEAIALSAIVLYGKVYVGIEALHGPFGFFVAEGGWSLREGVGLLVPILRCFQSLDLSSIASLSSTLNPEYRTCDMTRAALDLTRATIGPLVNSREFPK